jgi:hypothetical protein
MNIAQDFGGSSGGVGVSPPLAIGPGSEEVVVVVSLVNKIGNIPDS